MNKILLYGWGALGEEYTVEAFRQNGYEVIVYKRKVQDYVRQKTFCKIRIRPDMR